MAIVLADVFEAGSMAYMTWRYDSLGIALVWALVIARDIAAPFYAVYLSLAQTLPVGARDVLHLVEMGAGTGMARDAIGLANDPGAPLAKKAALYKAAAIMQPAERDRLMHMIAVLGDEASYPSIARQEVTLDGVVHASNHRDSSLPPQLQVSQENVVVDAEVNIPPGVRTPGGLKSQDTHTALPASTGTPAHALPTASEILSTVEEITASETPTHAAANRQSNGRRLNVRTLSFVEGSQPMSRRTRANAGRSYAQTSELRQRREAAAEQILKNSPAIGTRALARQIGELTGSECNVSTAQEICRIIRERLA